MLCASAVAHLIRIRRATAEALVPTAGRIRDALASPRTRLNTGNPTMPHASHDILRLALRSCGLRPSHPRPSRLPVQLGLVSMLMARQHQCIFTDHTCTP